MKWENYIIVSLEISAYFNGFNLLDDPTHRKRYDHLTAPPSKKKKKSFLQLHFWKVKTTSVWGNLHLKDRDTRVDAEPKNGEED